MCSILKTCPGEFRYLRSLYSCSFLRGAYDWFISIYDGVFLHFPLYHLKFFNLIRLRHLSLPHLQLPPDCLWTPFWKLGELKTISQVPPLFGFLTPRSNFFTTGIAGSNSTALFVHWILQLQSYVSEPDYVRRSKQSGSCTHMNKLNCQ